MPIPRALDSARRGDSRQPVPMPWRDGRTALRPGRRYTYRGTGHDDLTPLLSRPWGDLPILPIRALTSWQRLDVCEAIDGPSWFDWREQHEGDMT
jgi:hypothetical protein